MSSGSRGWELRKRTASFGEMGSPDGPHGALVLDKRIGAWLQNCSMGWLHPLVAEAGQIRAEAKYFNDGIVRLESKVTDWKR